MFIPVVYNTSSAIRSYKKPNVDKAYVITACNNNFKSERFTLKYLFNIAS